MEMLFKPLESSHLKIFSCCNSRTRLNHIYILLFRAVSPSCRADFDYNISIVFLGHIIYLAYNYTQVCIL